MRWYFDGEFAGQKILAIDFIEGEFGFIAMMNKILKIIEVSGEEVTKVAQDAVGIGFDFGVGGEDAILDGKL